MTPRPSLSDLDNAEYSQPNASSPPVAGRAFLTYLVAGALLTLAFLGIALASHVGFLFPNEIFRITDAILVLSYLSILGVIVLFERRVRRAEAAERSLREMHAASLQVRDSLLEREAHLRLALGQVPAILWTTDTHLRITSVIGEGLASPGLDPKEVVQAAMNENPKPTDPLATPVVVLRRAVGGESLRYEIEWKKRTFQVCVEPLRNTEKAITGTVGVALDVSDRNRSMVQVQERARQQAAVAKLGQEALSSKDLIGVMNTAVRLVREILNVDYCCVAVPAGATGVRLAAALGWDAKYAVGTVLDDSVDSLAIHTLKTGQSVFLIDLTQDPRFRNSRLLREHHVVSGLSFLLRSQAQCHGVLGAFTRDHRAFSQDDANFLHAVANILAARIGHASAEETRIQLEEQLRMAQKMEAIGQLAGGVAHDFNNLLCVIFGYSEFVLAALPADASQRKFVHEIKNAAERAASLTRQLLAFSRKQVLVPTVLDLNALVTNTQKFLTRIIGENIELTTQLEPVLEPIKADAGQIEQVIMNLGVNARDAMPEGGRFSIRTANVRLDALDLRRHPEAAPGPYVLLEVVDTGCGMPPDIVARVFEPFFTTKAVGKGTGLGLATVYGIVKQSGGHIEVDSAVGHGTTFKVYLPCLAGEAIPNAPETSVPRMPRGAETILLVEDEPGVRGMAKEVLENCGYVVIEACDGAEAMDLAERHQGDIDLLLTDAVMPRISGGQAAQIIIGKRPSMKVLFMSGYTDSRLVRSGISNGEIDCIFKPFTPDALACAVREVLDRQNHGVPQLKVGAQTPDRDKEQRC